MAKRIYGGLALQTQSSLSFFDADSSNSISLRSASTISSDFTLSLPAAQGSQNEVMLRGAGDALTFSLLADASIDASAAIALSKLAALANGNRALVSDGTGEISESAVTATELGHLSGVTSGVQSQIDGKVSLTGDTMTGNLLLDNASELRLGEADINGTEYVALKSPAALTTSLTLTLPSADASTAGDSLVSDGAGALSFATKASPALDNLTVGSLAAESLLVGSSSSAVSALSVGSEGQVLKVVAGSVAWANDAGASTFQADWITADGTSKVITHSLGTKDVIVQVYDKTDDATIELDAVVRTDANTVTITSSEAPGASGFRVLILDVS